MRTTPHFVSPMFALLLLVLSDLLHVNAQCQTSSSLSWKNAPKPADDVSTRVIYNGLNKPRGLRFAHDTIFIIENSVGIIGLVENSTNCAGFTKSVIAKNEDLSHGLVINDTDIYASTTNDVFHWTYNISSRTAGSQTTIVTGMDLSGVHKTRTLDLQPATASSPPYLIIAGGSGENLELEAADASHGTAQVRRFALNSSIPSSGYNWLDGELVAWGMRNAVGIAVSADGKQLWTVENSADQLSYSGVDIHQDNPSEELNLVNLSDVGHFYGYPSCFTTWDAQSASSSLKLNTGDQFSIDSAISDAQCRNTSFNVPPRMNMQAHSAPLDIIFYKAPGDATYAVNQLWNGHAFVSFHGSWNRNPPTGYGIVHIPWSGDQPVASPDSKDGYSFLLQAPDLTKCPSNCFRPVGLAFDSHGRLFGSSDTSGEIFIIESSNSPDARTSAGTKQYDRSRLATAILAMVTLPIWLTVL